MAGGIGLATTLTWHSVVVGELIRIGSVNLTMAKIDATTLIAADNYRSFIPGLITPGEIEIEGFLDPDDAGQTLLLTDFNARTEQSWLITFPAGVSAATWGGLGYVTAYASGDATPEGMVPFNVTIAMNDKPTLTP